MILKPEERVALDAGDFAEAVRRYVHYGRGKRLEDTTRSDLLEAVSLASREWLVDRMLESERRVRERGAKRVYYLSLEFLIGRSLEASLRNLDAYEAVREALAAQRIELDALCQAEPDAGLGNGGLGRLAACYLESLATLGLPGYGYGINYEHGLFRQLIERGEQHERPDSWRQLGSPWLIQHPEHPISVPVYGRAGRRPRAGAPGSWHDCRVIIGIPNDMPIAGHGGDTVNWLRLYSATTAEEFDVALFNQGDYLRAFERKLSTERISKILYPSGSTEAGQELRLLQEYFFVACALRDIVRRHLDAHAGLESLPERVAIQMNDTHPALAVPELMRILVDEHALPFERAFEITRATLAYTNHTLLPEALEVWPRPLLARVVPRHLQIVEEINFRFLADVESRWRGDVDRLRRTSIIEEGHPKKIRMGHLALVGSHTVNGVSRLHSELVRTHLLPDFAALWPERFQNVTNGVTPRRWLLQANPGLAGLITRRIGAGWSRDLERLRELEPALDEPGFRAELRAVKRANKVRLAELVYAETGIALDPDALFDVQVKRIHLYKRQLLAALHAIHLLLRVLDGETLAHPRACLFAGKAAPEYFLAKRVIRLLCEIARAVESEPRARRQLRVVFVPDYRVSLAEIIVPGADLSEQISTAGFEASGTGNMKLALNGALTMGTLDGANIEIRDAVGAENFYLFGLHAEEVEALRAGDRDPHRTVAESPRLARVIEALKGSLLSPDDGALFAPLLHHLFEERDPYFVLADFDAYCDAQERAARDYADADAWSLRSGRNVARMGWFSADRAVREYAERIWRVTR